MNHLYQQFIENHRLPQNYIEQIALALKPVIQEIKEFKKEFSKETFILGISGAQGSGKSTLANCLALMLSTNYEVVYLSLDDFYLSQQERDSLSKTIHPLLATRGVPGTHKLDKLLELIVELSSYGEKQLLIPSFDKLLDNPIKPSKFFKEAAAVDIVVLEGWCIGIPPQGEWLLDVAINDMEAKHDKDNKWRIWVNNQLSTYHKKLGPLINSLVYLKAPEWQQVQSWRFEQEVKLGDAAPEKPQMTMDEINSFIALFQRITLHGLTVMPSLANWVFSLDKMRHFTLEHRCET